MPSGPWQRDVEDEDVGPRRGDRREGRLRLLRLPAHHEVGLLVDQERETLSHDRVVVDDEDPVRLPTGARANAAGWDMRRSSSLNCCNGNRQLTTVPLALRGEPPACRRPCWRDSS